MLDEGWKKEMKNENKEGNTIPRDEEAHHELLSILVPLFSFCAFSHPFSLPIFVSLYVPISISFIPF